MRWVFSVPFQKWRNAEYWSKPAWGHRLLRGGGEARTTPTTPCHSTVHMHLCCWPRWVSCYFMSEAPGEPPPQPKIQKFRISRRQDWGSAHYFQYFQSLEYTHLIKTGGQTSILHTCTLGVSILTTQTRGEKMKKDLITVVLKRVSPP